MVNAHGRERHVDAAEAIAAPLTKSHRRRLAKRNTHHMLEHRPIAMPPNPRSRIVAYQKRLNEVARRKPGKALGPGHRRVYPSLPPSCPAARLPPHPPLRVARQRSAQGQSSARPKAAGRPAGARGAMPETPLDTCPPCPCCGGRMIVIETFARWGQPRAPPKPTLPIREPAS